MADLKSIVKRGLRAVGLYDTAQSLWARRSTVRVRLWNVGYRLAGSSDGLPIPPTRLVNLVADSKEVAWFLRGGEMGHQSICYALEKNDLRAEDFEAILDFGCGCGRVIRCWKSLSGPRIHGTDYNSTLIEWCRRHLGHLAEFGVNELIPPLDYASESFDFAYAISVFTHLPEDMQLEWMEELARVLKPGGVLLITVHGESRMFQLSLDEQRQFQAGQLVIKDEAAAGTNACGAYHPERYVQDHLAAAFDLVDFIPQGARDANQDIFLLRKPRLSSRIPAQAGMTHQ